MKKILILILVLVSLHTLKAQTGNEEPNSVTTKYFVIKGFEVSKNREERDQPVIINVIKVDCAERINSAFLTEELSPYYQAHYAKQRGCLHLGNFTTFEYLTKKEADAKRIEIIGYYNSDEKYELFLIDSFSFECPD